MVTVADLKKCEAELQAIFAMITTEKNGALIENQKYDHQRIRSLIRQAFAPKGQPCLPLVQIIRTKHLLALRLSLHRMALYALILPALVAPVARLWHNVRLDMDVI